MKVDADFLVERMRAGEKWRPKTWTSATMCHGGHCEVQGMHTFVRSTPKTIGVSVSPAVLGARDAIKEFGDEWECVE